ncbi:MAG: ATP-dependent sacrificial sulfur transferase LarE [Acidobacteriota bacterium]|nr:ATP-dependent sacrificial sulfur transferase LarE [Pyrinomonadaceae bacterium]MDW8303250.1 ATP-dependent sacrificial sulfur transferase LarE [Acidobacteriota bacterium]
MILSLESEEKALLKEARLRETLKKMDSALIAYSGGVDSSYLALVATEELADKAFCVMGISPSVSRRQRVQAEKIAKDFGFNYRVIETEEINDSNYKSNPSNRCYFCKSELYTKLRCIAEELGVEYILDGSIVDDLSDFRPGRQAALENNVRSPLIEVGLKKQEIRFLSRRLGLYNWNEPSSPCLSSRIAYGLTITVERLGQVEKGEEILRQLGFREFRVRVHGELVRIEISRAELEKIFDLEIFDYLSKRFHDIGFRYVTLDLEGYRSGSMNLK